MVGNVKKSLNQESGNLGSSLLPGQVSVIYPLLLLLFFPLQNNLPLLK